jgi:hypothetical protein
MFKESNMFLIGVIFLGLWIAGLSTSYTLGGFIHALPVLAVVALFGHMIRGTGSDRLAEMRAAAAPTGTLGSEAKEIVSPPEPPSHGPACCLVSGK